MTIRTRRPIPASGTGASAVAAWRAESEATGLFPKAVSEAERLYGLAILPAERWAGPTVSLPPPPARTGPSWRPAK